MSKGNMRTYEEIIEGDPVSEQDTHPFFENSDGPAEDQDLGNRQAFRETLEYLADISPVPLGTGVTAKDKGELCLT